MLEDPWAHLYPKDDTKLSNENANASLSDSLRPQLGDSFINPAPEVPDDLENTNDLSAYSYSSEKGEQIGNDDEIPVDENEDSGRQVSESMIALVGDSLLERNAQDFDK